jgi:predicted nucleic acid-binding protein
MSSILVVSDTGPIHYLTLLGRIDLLPHFFGEVLVPSAVLQELNHSSTPQVIREFMSSQPDWLNVVDCPVTDPKFNHFGVGEREALTMAFLNPGAVLLCDDGAARAAAIKEKIAVSGTLGVLRDAALCNLLDIRMELDRLRTETSFHGSDKLFDHVCSETERQIRQRTAS